MFTDYQTDQGSFRKLKKKKKRVLRNLLEHKISPTQSKITIIGTKVRICTAVLIAFWFNGYRGDIFVYRKNNRKIAM